MKRLVFVLAGLVLLIPALWALARAPGFQLFGELTDRVDTPQPVIALTFDDGPTHTATGAILDILEEKQVQATFFLVGEAMAQRPELTRRIVAAGHQVGNHSYTHQRMVAKAPAFISDELERTDTLIREAGYTDEIVFRPPYGKKLFVLPWLLRKRGMRTVTWDLAPESELGRGATPEQLVQQVRSRVRPGSIVLLHVMFQAREPSLKAVPDLIDTLRDEGYRFVTVNELISLESNPAGETLVTSLTPQQTD